MGTVLHPVGPLPPGAYWVRRGVLLAVLIAVVAGGWFLLGGGSSTGSPANSPGPTSHPTTSTTPSATPTPTPTVSATHSATPAAVTLCPDSVIRVEAVTDAASYPAGVDPKLSVSVTNTGKVPCKRDIGRAAMSLVVSLGTTRIWSSEDCSPGGQPAVNVLRPGQTFSSTVVWARISSKPGCPSGQPAAAAGSYSLVAANLSLKSAPAPFVLH